MKQQISSCNSVAATLDSAVTENGISLVDLVEASPVLLVFLRHAGCTFCREALSDISATRAQIEASGTRPVLVHMGDEAEMKAMVTRYGVADLERICDPDGALYAAFGLRKGTFLQLYGPKVWFRGLLFRAFISSWHRFSRGGFSTDARRFPYPAGFDSGPFSSSQFIGPGAVCQPVRHCFVQHFGA